MRNVRAASKVLSTIGKACAEIVPTVEEPPTNPEPRAQAVTVRDSRTNFV